MKTNKQTLWVILVHLPQMELHCQSHGQVDMGKASLQRFWWNP